MEAWELKAGLEVILGSANRELTLSDLARGLGIDELGVEDVLRDLEADLAAADRGWQDTPSRPWHPAGVEAAVCGTPQSCDPRVGTQANL